MPNRIIKESINESKGLSEVSFFAEDLYKRLITYADDYGRFNADCQIMRARLYPRELEIVSESDIEDALIELSGIGKVAFYTSEAKKDIYGCLPKWSEHQRIRESKNKCPDPDDTSINDWYLRRFIPIDMKINIIERDGFKCQICGKYISSIENAYAVVKKGAGLFHIDHIVPVSQGGRVTMENLRLTCPKCNQSRKKKFTFDEILEITRSSQKLAESCGEAQKNAASIQSNTESESESNTHNKRGAETPLADVEPITLNDGTEWKCPLADYEEYKRLYPGVDIDNAFREMRAWCNSNPTKRKTARGIKRFVNGWLSRQQDSGKACNTSKPAKNFNNFDRRNYDMDDLERRLLT